MLIKKNAFNFSIKNFNYLYSFAIIIIVIFSITFGVFLNKWGYTAFINKFITLHTYHSVFDHSKKLISVPFHNVEKVYMDINFENLKKLSDNRNIALANNVILKEYNENVNVNFKYLNKEIKAQIKLKGGSVKFHLDKYWSFKVRLKDSNILGLSEFALMHPKRRNYLLEWYARKLFKYVGLIYKDYKFVNLYINGENKGLYAMDENYTENLSTKNNRKEGLYLRYSSDICFNDTINYAKNCWPENYLKSTRIDLLNQNSFLKNDIQIKYLKNAEKKLDLLRNNKISPEFVFDLELFAKAFALSDLLGAWHSMSWSNMKFYFNPFTNLLEPVVEDNYNENTVYPTIDRLLRISDAVNYNQIYRVLFENKIFMEKYIFFLNLYSSEDYLKKFNTHIKKEFDKNLKSIIKFNKTYLFPHDMFENNRRSIINFLNQKDHLHFALWENNEKIVKIRYANVSHLPLEFISVDFLDENQNLIIKKDLEKKFIFPRAVNTSNTYQFIELKNNKKLQFKYINLNYKILGTNKIFNAKIEDPKIMNNENIKDEVKNETFSNFLFIDKINKKLIIPKGEYKIDSDLYIPKGYEFIVEAGTILDITKNSKIISESMIAFIGSENNPIIIHSSDKLGQCIIVKNSSKLSLIKNVYFKNLSNCSSPNMELSGSINFYNSHVKISNSNFYENIKGDDYVNIVNSNFNISDIIFNRAKYDAIDIDYSNGDINNIFSIDTGNDVLDLSNSTVKLSNFNSNNALDKAISIGERSKLNAENLNIDKAFIGIAIKDESEVLIENVNISNTNFGIATYIKKIEYEPVQGEITKYIYNNNKVNKIIESKSNISINSKTNHKFKNNVINLLYPG